MLLCAGLSALTAQANDTSYPELFDEDELSVMGLLSDLDWHDPKHERWNAYVQGTYISQWQPAFHAAYSNLNGSGQSLTNQAGNSFTATVTPYLSFKAWTGGEFYDAPEMISERPLSNLKGLGGEIQNFELQKTGSEHSTWYNSRAYFRQTFALGGIVKEVDSGPLQIAGTVDSRRFVFTVGKLSVIDIFDKNTYAGDLRHQFFNMAFMTNAAYDFAADARGYSEGIAGEYYYDDWAFRFGRFAVPTEPNTLIMAYDIFKLYGDQIELEHKHEINGQHGAIRFLAYRNRVNSGKFSDAIAAYQSDPSKNAAACTGYNYGSNNTSAPDLCYVRHTNTKMGIGINMEQSISHDLGIFFRGMISDGQTEVYNYTAADQSLSFGGIMKGSRWGRGRDSVGLGYAQSFLSKSHIQYLNMGGIDDFLGDGRITYKPERVIDIYYQCHVVKSAWVSFDYQHLINPGYNADRGPVDIYGARVQLEF